MGVRKDIVKLDIEVNGNKAQKELFQLEERAAQLNSEMKGLKRSSQEYIDKQKELKTVRAQMDELRGSMKLTELTQRQLNQEIARLRLIKSNLKPGSEAFNEYNQRLNKAIAQQTQLRTNLTGFQKVWRGIRTEVKQFGVLFIGALGIQELFQQMGNIITRSAEMSDALSDVRKTTGLTEKEVEELNKELSKIDTRTGRRELLAIAEAGGRLNVAKRDILEFTRAVDKANVALGDKFTGGAEEVATTLGKIQGAFKETRGLRIEKAFDSIGSAINELGATTKASDPELANFTQRVGSMPDAIKPTIQDTLALSAITQEAGIQSEIASRGFSIFFRTAAERTPEFAKFLGLSNDEVERLINTDITEFLKVFAKQLDGLSATDTARVLNDLGLGAEGAIKAIGSVSSNLERFEEIQGIANSAFREGTSLADEFAIKNENLAAKLAKVQKAIRSNFSTPFLRSTLGKALDFTAQLFEKTEDVTKSLKDEQIALNSLANQILKTNEGSEARLSLVRKLKEEYPQFLDDLKEEEATNARIVERLKQTNEQYLARIIIRKQEAELERLQKIKDEAAFVSEEIASEIRDLESETQTILETLFGFQRPELIQTSQITEALQNTVNELYSDLSDLSGEHIDAFDRLVSINARLNGELREQVDAQIALESANKSLETQQTKNQRSLERLAETYPELAEVIRFAFSEATDAVNEAENSSSGRSLGQFFSEADVDHQKELAERLKTMADDFVLSQLEGYEREEEIINRKYQKELAYAAKHGLDLQQIIVPWTIEIAALREQYELEASAKREEARQAELQKVGDFWERVRTLQEEFRLNQLSDEEAERQAIRDKYSKLIVETEAFYLQDLLSYEQYLVTKATLTAQYVKEDQDVLNRHSNLRHNMALNEQKQVLNAYGSMFGSLANMANQFSQGQYGLLVFQQISSLAEIIMNQAVAISSAVRGASVIAFPGNIAAIASSVATVVAAMAGAIGTLKSAKVPAPPKIRTVQQRKDGGYVDVRGKQTGKRYRAKARPDIDGGFIQSDNLVLAGEDGRPEYFVNATMLENPSIATVVAAMEQYRTGGISVPDFNGILADLALGQMAQGGFTQNATRAPETVDGSSNDTASSGLTNAIMRLVETNERLYDAVKDGIPAVYGDETVRVISERQDLFSEIEQNAD